MPNGTTKKNTSVNLPKRESKTSIQCLETNHGVILKAISAIKIDTNNT